MKRVVIFVSGSVELEIGFPAIFWVWKFNSLSERVDFHQGDLWSTMTFWQLLFKKTRHTHHLHCSPRLCESQDATTLSGICPGVAKRKKRRPCKSCQGFASQEATYVKKCEKSPHSPWIAPCSSYVRSKHVQCLRLPRGRTLFTVRTSCRILVVGKQLRVDSAAVSIFVVILVQLTNSVVFVSICNFNQYIYKY